MTNDQLFNRSPKQAMKYYYIIEGLEFIVSLIVSVILIFLWSHFNWWHFIIYLIVAFIVFDFVRLLIRPWIKFKYTFYRIKENYIEVKYDFFFKSKKIVKLERTQLIERQNNPILKKMRLSKTTLITAGHRVSFPLMFTDDAKSFELLTLNYLRGADFDV